VEFAQLHPESEVVGSDLTQIQPTSGLANLSFVQEDSEEHPWVHDRPFDYIHLRYVYTCFDSPQSVIRSAFENLNPGGWIEFQDATMELHSNKGPAHIESNPLKRLFDLAIQGAAAQGRNIVVSRFYKQWLLEAGFVDVVEIKLAIPINEWHPSLKLKRVGQYTSRMLMDSLGGVAWKMLRAKGFSDEEVNETIVQTKPEIRNLDLEAFFPL
jgi:ubiquinone/menaquinone biosynthesis C-methylase UbiE